MKRASRPNYRAALEARRTACYISGVIGPARERASLAAGQIAETRKPQRGDMVIARDKRNLRKPRRGGMVLARTGQAAPTGLEEVIGGAATINMSLLRSWPNPAAALDGGRPARFAFLARWPAASERRR